MTDAQILSWALTLVGLVGFWLAGKKVWWAWHVNIFNQALWLTYSLVTHQYAFILGALVYTVVFFRNAQNWTRDREVTA